MSAKGQCYKTRFYLAQRARAGFHLSGEWHRFRADRFFDQYVVLLMKSPRWCTSMPFPPLCRCLVSIPYDALKPTPDVDRPGAAASGLLA
jgi:hypothetical protein